jgi:hypothetical protein
MIDGGPRALPRAPVDAWLVTDERGELMPQIRRLARRLDVTPAVSPFARRGLMVWEETGFPLEREDRPRSGRSRWGVA